jgi:indolepyruvate ferredoxin oxidoreductase beta subunit
MKYPEDIEGWLNDHIPGAVILDTSAALKEAGSSKSLNIVMVGALSRFLEFSEEEWTAALKATIKEKLLDMNLKAFQLGRSLIASS